MAATVDGAIADAIRAIAVANAMGWVIVAQLLEEKGVTGRDEFADMLAKAAAILDQGGPADDPRKWTTGADMLRMASDQLHDAVRGANPTKFKPTVVR